MEEADKARGNEIEIFRHFRTHPKLFPSDKSEAKKILYSLFLPNRNIFHQSTKITQIHRKVTQ
jgi:hypothetical protein